MGYLIKVGYQNLVNCFNNYVQLSYQTLHGRIDYSIKINKNHDNSGSPSAVPIYGSPHSSITFVAICSFMRVGCWVTSTHVINATS